jgi:hypothetical protein
MTSNNTVLTNAIEVAIFFSSGDKRLFAAQESASNYFALKCVHIHNKSQHKDIPQIDVQL